LPYFLYFIFVLLGGYFILTIDSITYPSII
jgi:hypothetical protein